MKAKIPNTVPVIVKGTTPYAHRSVWALSDANSEAYGLLLYDSNDKLIAVSAYTYSDWMDMFEQLQIMRANVVLDEDLNNAKKQKR